MSVKSTYDVPRSVAIEIIQKKLLGNVSNEELADMLESFPESYFRNYNVFNDKNECSTLIYEEFSILSSHQF